MANMLNNGTLTSEQVTAHEVSESKTEKYKCYTQMVLCA